MSYEKSRPRERECGVFFSGVGLRGRVANPIGFWTLTPPICVGSATEGGSIYDDADDAITIDPLGRSWGSIGPSWGPRGIVLGVIGGILGSLGSLLGRIGSLWAALRALLGRLGALLGRLGALLGASWAVLDGVTTTKANEYAKSAHFHE